ERRLADDHGGGGQGRGRGGVAQERRHQGAPGDAGGAAARPPRGPPQPPLPLPRGGAPGHPGPPPPPRPAGREGDGGANPGSPPGRTVRWWGRAAASPIHSGIVGIERRISISRWMAVSTAPPEKPEIPPRTTPSTRLMATPQRPMVREVRVPYIRRDQRSRPCSSVPKRKSVSSARPSPTARRGRSVGIS